jgi:thymidylate kinase
MKTPKYICITGPDGSGKSTLIFHVINSLKQNGKYKVEMISIWDMMLYIPETKDLIGFKSKSDSDKYLSLLDPIARSLFLFHIFYQSLEYARKNREADIFIIDSYWYKYFATEIAHGVDRDTASKIVEIFPELDLTIYLNITPSIGFNRKDKCSGYEIGWADEHTEEAFVSFQQKAYEEFNKLKKLYGWFQMDGTNSIENNLNTAMQKIEEVMTC